MNLLINNTYLMNTGLSLENALLSLLKTLMPLIKQKNINADNIATLLSEYAIVNKFEESHLVPFTIKLKSNSKIFYYDTKSTVLTYLDLKYTWNLNLTEQTFNLYNFDKSFVIKQRIKNYKELHELLSFHTTFFRGQSKKKVSKISNENTDSVINPPNLPSHDDIVSELEGTGMLSSTGI
jgi:hypothetical protein